MRSWSWKLDYEPPTPGTAPYCPFNATTRDTHVTNGRTPPYSIFENVSYSNSSFERNNDVVSASRFFFICCAFIALHQTLSTVSMNRLFQPSRARTIKGGAKSVGDDSTASTVVQNIASV